MAALLGSPDSLDLARKRLKLPFAIRDGSSVGWHGSECYSGRRIWQNLCGPIPSGSDGFWHVTLPTHGRFTGLSLPGLVEQNG